MRGFFLGFLLTLLAVPALAGKIGPDTLWTSDAEAYAACVSDAAAHDTTGGGFCRFNPGNSVSPRAECIQANPSMGNWSNASYSSMNSTKSVAYNAFYWCVASSCAAGTSPDGQADYSFADPGGGVGAGQQVSSSGGCCETLDLAQSAWSAADKSDAVTTGHFVLSGGYCAGNFSTSTGGTIPKPPILTPYDHCKKGVASCYNPFDDNFCSQSQSGEWFCVPRKTPDPGGCASGATGSECLGKDGNPVPPPPDPPIKNGTPPDTTNNYTINDAGTTNNYTTNNYSGTSSGGSGSESPPPGSSSPGGTGSNTGGSGNTGKNGTDANGNCPNGSKPTASGCSGTYRDDGCDTPPACFGDAVLCGIAANTHKSACAASGSSIGSPPSSYAGDPTDNSADPGSSAVSSSVDLGAGSGNLDGSGFGYSTSCPLQDISFETMGSSVVIPLADKCNLLSFLKYIVLALAYFMAAKIIAGVK